MNIIFSSDVERVLKKIKKKDKQLIGRIEKQLDIFVQNPKHPSLRSHKLTGSMENMWSLAITVKIRMVYLLFDEKNALMIKIGAHDQVYRK